MVNRLGQFVKNEQERLSKELGRDVTQVEIAVRMEINPTTLSRYINSKPDSINWDIWKKLSDYFGVSGHELFDVLPEVD